MNTLRLDNLRTLLCLGAHSDDIEIGCGGAVLKLLQTYGPLHVCWVVLSGDPTRAAEARASAAQFLSGAAESRVEIAQFRDSFFPDQYASLKEFMHHLSREVAPDLIFTHHRADLHQDHRLVAELTTNAFRDPLVLEYEIPKWDGDLGRPNVYVPLTARQCQEKVAALMEHFGSQRPRRWFTPETFQGLMRIRGIECNAPEGYAEAFHCRKACL